MTADRPPPYTADDAPIFTLLEWPAPPGVVGPVGELAFAAPGTIGRVFGIGTGPDGKQYTAVRFRYRSPTGGTSWSEPICVLPGQPCTIAAAEKASAP